MDYSASLLYLVAFCWGAIWGSFLNVCIYRMPAGRSIIRPASHCPACSEPLKAWHNIPILGWVLLGGRCGFCRAGIAARYPLVESLMGVLSVALLADSLSRAEATFLSDAGALAGIDPGPGLGVVLFPFLYHFVFVAGLVVITFIDLDHLEIPNEVTLPGVLIGFGGSLVLYPYSGAGVVWWSSLLGALVGGGFLLALIGGYALLTGREGMGLGDFKLMAMVGAFLGIQALPLVLFASAAQGLLYAVLLLLTGRGDAHRDQLLEIEAREAEAAGAGDEHCHEEGPAEPAAESESALSRLRSMPIPFGPFIALAAIQWLFVGDRVSLWLAGLFG